MAAVIMLGLDLGLGLGLVLVLGSGLRLLPMTVGSVASATSIIVMY